MDLLGQPQRAQPWWKRRAAVAGVSTLAVFMLAFVGVATMESAAATSYQAQQQDATRRLTTARKVTVFGSLTDNAIARKQQQDLEQSLPSDRVVLEPVLLAQQEQLAFVRQSVNCGETAAARFTELVDTHQEQLATEVFKYCALQSRGGTETVAFVDSVSPLVVRLQDFLADHESSSVAVLGDDYFPNTVHGSLVVLAPKQIHVAERMLAVLLETPVETLIVKPLLIPRTLHALIAAQAESLSPGRNDDWFLLQQKCHVDPLRRPSEESSGWTDAQSFRLNHHCPDKAGFCCFVMDPVVSETILMTRHPLLPFQKLPVESVRPYNAEAGHFEEEELPFIATIQEKVFVRPQEALVTPNFFDVLVSNDCLPSDDTCSKCLREKSGANCDSCAQACPCYCKTLCHEQVDTKFLAKQLTVSPPLYARDPNRLVPRIIHQTWFEELNRDKYPNMSRLVESFKQSGWEYKFYADEDAASFLSTHFPAEVREAYDAILPGAFKADLFRYCVLLIHGGVYADVDIMLESALDLSVAPDVGFMVPIDEPGIPVDKRMCLWNGLIASAPGHPYLARAIETVVNQVRNRFTSVDVDATFCPAPELSILHAFDTLFTAGPCLLGASINRVLERNAQTQFVAGEIPPSANTSDLDIPGRTIILQQNKWDMGAHRFTHVDQNIVVAATDMPDSNDLANLQTNKEHYSKTHAKTGIYGLEHLYADKSQANADIRIQVATDKHLLVAATGSSTI